MAERQLLHVPAPLGLETRGLLDRAEFETALLSGKIPIGKIQIVTGYKAFDPNDLMLADGDRLRAELLRFFREQNTTFVASGVELAVPRLLDLAREAEQLLGDRVTISAVQSNRVKTGLSPHHDSENLIIVQLEGAKKWYFHGAPVAGSCMPVNRDAAVSIPKAPVTDELVMRPGDLLYVPSGLRHRCEPQEASLHLAIGIVHQSGASLLRELRGAMRDRPELFEPLVRFLGVERTAAQAEEYKLGLGALLDSLDPRALLDARIARQLTSGSDRNGIGE